MLEVSDRSLWTRKMGRRRVQSHPASLRAALLRAMRNRCPSCGGSRLFPTFLKPVSDCEACGQDWTHQRADDFPAYVATLLAGHVIVPSAILLEQFADPPIWVHLALWLPLATTLLLGLLQPVKGAIIALQWWCGMHGFEAGSIRKPVSAPASFHHDND